MSCYAISGDIRECTFKTFQFYDTGKQFQTDRLSMGKKSATVNRLIATISHMFTKAVEWGMVEEEIQKRIRKVKLLPENNRRLRYLSPEECQRLVDSCDKHLKPIVITALNTV